MNIAVKPYWCIFRTQPLETKKMTSSEDILKVQESAQHVGLIFCSFVLFLHGIGFGAGLGYAGLVLPHHVG